MTYTLKFWSIHRRPATLQHPAFAFVYIKGVHNGLVKKESYNIPYLADSRQNTNEALVKRAIQLSANQWRVPLSMNFK
jgi:hypothetical protein